MKNIDTVKLACEMGKEMMEAQNRGENNLMIGCRLSGMVRGLEIAGVVTKQEATEMIINLKNEFNF